MTASGCRKVQYQLAYKIFKPQSFFRRYTRSDYRDQERYSDYDGSEVIARFVNCETNSLQTGLLLVFRAEIVWITVFLTVGAIGGLVYNWPSSTEDPAAQSIDETIDPADVLAEQSDEIDDTWPFTDETRENPQSPTVQESESQTDLAADPIDDVWSEISPPMKRTQKIDSAVVELGDRLLLGGNYEGAMKHYQKLLQTVDVPTDNGILIRLALASELAHEHDDAIKHYRSAIRVVEKGSVAQANCLLGIARVWENRGQFNDAASLLSELYLIYGGTKYPQLLRAQLVSQLSDCLQKRVLSSQIVIDALQNEPMEYYWPAVTVDHVLELVDWEAPVDGLSTPPSQLQVLQSPNKDASVVLVGANVRGLSVLGLLTEIERGSGMVFNLTEKAKTDLVGRMTNVQTTAMPVSFLLDSVLESMALTWSQSEGEVSVMHREELADRDLASYDLARTQRMLRQVQLEVEPGPRRTAAIMNEGNNSRLAGGWEEARTKYQMAREQTPMHELSAKLYFNEASLQLADGEKLDALNACYMALDQTLTASLEGDVYAMISELELELGQTDKAILAGSRGLRRATEPAVLSRCAMMLARAYLLTEDPDSANQVLFDQSPHIVGDATQRVASVFSSFARFQRNPSRGGLQDEGQRLVMALATLKPNDPAGFADALIVSQAYASVGIRNKAVESLKESLAKAPKGFWSERIRLELARAQYGAGHFDAADETISNYGQVSIDLLPTVLLLHAKIKFDAGKLEQCESICRRIARLEVDQTVQAEALNTLGMVLNEKGQHYAATLCFAGVLPEPVETTSSHANQGVVVP